VVRTRADLARLDAAWLAPFAERSDSTRGRKYPATPHPYRSEFQKDRDRIMYTTAFRRLQYKTQVFITYEGDYFRTRLTHTSEAAQLARTLARALGANEDLAEAITLAHDLGHPPFGHSGEATLDGLLLDRLGIARTATNRGRGFNHTVQSLRIVERLERRWTEHPGLNLTWETREGIVKHDTEYDAVGAEWRAPYMPELRPSLEAQIVNFADELAYTTHDLDDGLRSGLLAMDMAELRALDLWRAVVVDDPDPELRRHRALRRLVDLLISDLVTASAAALSAAAPRSADDVRAQPGPLMMLSAPTAAGHAQLKEFLMANLYRHSRLVRMFRKAERVLTELFEAFEADYRQLPPHVRANLESVQPGATPGDPFTEEAYRVMVDYLSGMTDRYALQEHDRLFDPGVRA
jgi:dGTPase